MHDVIALCVEYHNPRLRASYECGEEGHIFRFMLAATFPSVVVVSEVVNDEQSSRSQIHSSSARACRPLQKRADKAG